MRRAKPIYSDLAIVRESATTPCLAKTQRQAEECEGLIVE